MYAGFCEVKWETQESCLYYPGTVFLVVKKLTIRTACMKMSFLKMKFTNRERKEGIGFTVLSLYNKTKMRHFTRYKTHSFHQLSK